MRKIVYIISAIVGTISMSSCDKLLDRQPLDYNPDLTASYRTPEHLDANLRSVYSTLKSSALYGGQMHYMLGLEADEGYYSKSGTSVGTHANNYTSGQSNIYSFWRDLYIGIGKANTFIANVDFNKDIDEGLRNKLRGEALFLRGYFYFMLVKSFGGVPLILEPLEDVENVDIPRATAKEVYEQILQDMTQAEGLVDGIQVLGHGGRVSKSAVRGILARVCLHMAGYPVRETSKYAEAKEWASKVINDPEFKHELNPSFSQIFINYAQDIYDPKESIWEVEFMGNGLDAYSETGPVGYLTGPYSLSDVIGQSFGGIKVTSKLWDVYTPTSLRGATNSANSAGDLRRDWTIAGFEYDGSTHNFSGSYSTSYTVLYRNYRYAGKFRREYETLLPKHRTRTPQNFPLLRYADVLLMYAEADYETVHNGLSNGEPSQEARDALMQVRMRSFNVGGIRNFGYFERGSGYTSPPTVYIADDAYPSTSRAAVTATLDSKGAVTFVLERDPVTGFKMGSGYEGQYLTLTISNPPSGGVKARGNARPYQVSDIDYTEAELDDFRKTIQDERLRELAFETHRKWDLVRWNIYEFEMRQVRNILNSAGLSNRFFYSFFENTREKHALWPIPARELNLNKALEQNPGW